IRTGTAFLDRRGRDEVRTTGGRIRTGYVINAAGLYADRIARRFGFSADHRILPFKGLYLYALDDPGIRTHVYPVPSLDYPFLGVHLTVTARHQVKIGPTAIPALWREQYRGLRNFNAGEFAEVARRQAGLFAANPAIRRLAMHELAKRSRRRMLQLAAELVSLPIAPARWRSGEPGIRAQLYDVKRGRLEMDFRLEGDDRSLHVLNAVSPAFTSAFPFAEHAFDEIERRTGRRPIAATAEALTP
ncbi:MAG: NAD(P)/FAD-dependent oxidoreductase, partial [Longimicrobiales bacterium]